jgi:hypothetical protein
MLIFVGVALWIPELWIAWVVITALFLPVTAPHTMAKAQMHVHLNASAWVLAIGWTALCWALAGRGVRLLLKSPREPDAARS